MQVQPNGFIEGLSTEGWIHIEVLELNDPELVEWRASWNLKLERWKDPDCDPGWKDAHSRELRFPDSLPDLRVKDPPEGTDPDNRHQCYFALREAGLLPEFY
jgi:hypothetical protein